MVDEPISLGELSRNLRSLERRISEQFGQINLRLDNLHFVPRDLYEIQVKQINDRVEELEESRRWQVRTTVAAFLYPLLVGIIIALVVVR